MTAPLTAQARADRLLTVLAAARTAHADAREAFERLQDDHEPSISELARAENTADDAEREATTALEFLMAHVELTGVLPTAWQQALADSITPEEAARYTASLTPRAGQHAVTRQFTVTCRLHEGSWVIDPGCLYADGLDLDGVAEHAHDCPCGDHGGHAGRDEVDAAQSLPAPTPGQLAASIRHAYAIATTPPPA